MLIEYRPDSSFFDSSFLLLSLSLSLSLPFFYMALWATFAAAAVTLIGGRMERERE
jgi:hypothetical protein